MKQLLHKLMISTKHHISLTTLIMMSNIKMKPRKL